MESKIITRSVSKNLKLGWEKIYNDAIENIKKYDKNKNYTNI